MNANEITIDITIGRLNQMKEFEGRAVSLLEASMMANELLARRAQDAKQEVRFRCHLQCKNHVTCGSSGYDKVCADFHPKEAAKQPAPVVEPVAGASVKGQCPVCGGWASQCDCTFPTQPAKPLAEVEPWEEVKIIDEGTVRNAIQQLQRRFETYVHDADESMTKMIQRIKSLEEELENRLAKEGK